MQRSLRPPPRRGALLRCHSMQPRQPEPPKTDEELQRRIKNVTAHMVYQYLMEASKQPDAEAQVVAMDVGEKAANVALAEMNWWKVW